MKLFLTQLTHHPGVYQMLGTNGVVLYVGKAKDLKKRVSSYFNKKHTDPKTLALVKQVIDIDITITHSEIEALLLECNLIKKYRPKYNILLRDDKSYPGIIISDHAYPRIDQTRGRRTKQGHYFGPFPSALAVKETISNLQKIFKLRTCRDSFFAVRQRPCLLYQIKRCTAPCVGLVSKEDYARQVEYTILFLAGKNDQVIHYLQGRMEDASNNMQYEIAAELRDQIARLRQIHNTQCINVKEGSIDVLAIAYQEGIACVVILSIRGGQILGSRSYFPSVPLQSSQEIVLSAFIAQHYLAIVTESDLLPQYIYLPYALKESAALIAALKEKNPQFIDIIQPKRGKKYKWIEMALSSAKQSLSAKLYQLMNMHERFLALQQCFLLDSLPKHIECFDISHTMGEATIASCVVFDENGPVKSAYRRFNINNITPGDDVAAMKQAIIRRYQRCDDSVQQPDIILIDGGRLQLAACQEAFISMSLTSPMLVAISKGPGRKPGFEALHRQNQQSFHLPADNKALLLMQQIRDEAHRFAITGHRLKRDKERRQSKLEQIHGVGPQKRRELLRYFGGIQGVAHASLDELTKVHGINHALAERIFAAFHDETI